MGGVLGWGESRLSYSNKRLFPPDQCLFVGFWLLLEGIFQAQGSALISHCLLPDQLKRAAPA